MKINKDSNTYTVVFAVIMVIIVGSVLAGLASGLAPLVSKNEEIEKMQNILFAMNVTDKEDTDEFVPKDEVEDYFKRFIGDRQFILEGSSVLKTNEAFKIGLKNEESKFKNNPNYNRKLPVFVGVNNGKTYYIIPLEGKGLWGRIWGYVSLNEDFDTVKGAFFDHQTETAGLGANIKEAFFREDFIDEKIVDQQGNFKGIEVSKSNGDPLNQDKNDNQVDAIAGATITGNGVSNMIKNGIGLYLPHLELIKSEL